MHSRIVATAVALIWSSLASAAHGAVLQPVENWHLDYGDTQCTAARSFYSPSGSVVLGLVPSLSGNSYRLLVSVPRTGPAFAQESRGSVDFGRGAINSSVLYYGRKAVPFSVYQFRLSAADLGQARSAETVTLRSENGGSYTFGLSEMLPLLHALAKCTANLQQYWNMAGQTTVSRAAAPSADIPSLFAPADYPAEALKRLQEGSVQYQLLIDTNGAVAGCDVSFSSGVAALDATGCEIIEEKARFTPAVDNQGNLVRSVWTSAPVVWKIAENALDSACTKVSADGRTLVMACEQPVKRGMQPMPTITTARPSSRSGKY